MVSALKKSPEFTGDPYSLLIGMQASRIALLAVLAWRAYKIS